MSKQLIIGNQVFSYPEQGTDPGWGAEATAWAEAVSDAINGLSTPGDISPSQFQTTAQNTWVTIPGLKFDELTSQGATITILVSRQTTTPNVTVQELTVLYAVQLNVGNWVFSNVGTKSADVEYQFVYSGNVAQLQIFPNEMVADTHLMKLAYSAKANRLP